MFAKTVLYSDTIYDKTYAYFVILISNSFFCLWAENFSILMNTALCIDLVLIVRYPFEKKEKRIPYYLGITLVLGCCVSYG